MGARVAALRYVVYDPKDPRKGTVLLDPALREIILGEGKTISLALLAAGSAPPGAVVWDRREKRVAYVIPQVRR
jgi:hypothetical protein